MKPLLIVPSPQGYLGNRLIHLAGIRAFAQQFELPLLYPSLHPYADLFTGPARSLFVAYDPDGNLFNSPLFHNVVVLLDKFLGSLKESGSEMLIGAGETFREARSVPELDGLVTPKTRDVIFAFGMALRSWVENGAFPEVPATILKTGDDPVELEQYEPLREAVGKQQIIVLDGWGFASQYSLERQRESILEYLTPQPEKIAQVQRVVGAARAHGGALIGVHVRRGDYKIWQNGRYFFELPRYHAEMAQLREKFAGRNPRFLISSNEDLTEADFPGFSVTISGQEPIVDMYALAACDALVGPPSTFSGWASLVSGVPVQRMV